MTTVLEQYSIRASRRALITCKAYEICLGVHFALCVNKYIKQYASKRTVSLVNYCYTYTHAHTHTHARTHTHTHTHTHTQMRMLHGCMYSHWNVWERVHLQSNIETSQLLKVRLDPCVVIFNRTRLVGGFALSFKIDGHFVFESTRKAYKSWVKFRNTISWEYPGGIPSQLLKVCIVRFNWIAILFDSKRECERDEQKKKNASVSDSSQSKQFFFQLISGSTALEFTWTQISEPLGQYLGIPYPSTQLTPSSARWCHYLTLKHRHRSRKHLQCRSPSRSLPGFGCTRLLCENSLQVSSMDRVLMVLDLSQ